MADKDLKETNRHLKSISETLKKMEKHIRPEVDSKPTYRQDLKGGEDD